MTLASWSGAVCALAKDNRALKEAMVNHLYDVNVGEAVHWAKHFGVERNQITVRQEVMDNLHSKLARITPRIGAENYYQLPERCHIIFVDNSNEMKKMNVILSKANVITFDTESFVVSSIMVLL